MREGNRKIHAATAGLNRRATSRTASCATPPTGRIAQGERVAPSCSGSPAASHSLSSRHHHLTQGYAAHAGIAGIQFTILTTIRYLETKGDVFPVTIAAYLRPDQRRRYQGDPAPDANSAWSQRPRDLDDRRRASWLSRRVVARYWTRWCRCSRTSTMSGWSA